MYRLRFPLHLFLYTLLTLSAASAKESLKTLPPRYRDWLRKEVVYVISNQEKEAFLQLSTDPERDSFIDRFWEIRNPTPGAPTNPYKEEHYKRLDYAMQYFSHNKERDGWDTDMGRVWITLGAPQQKARYVTQSEVRGMEIWFYSTGTPGLPPNFYVVFWEKDFGDFRLYSPYLDGPNKLVTGYHAEQGRVQAVKEIDHALGREVARTTLSLLPGEPVNLNDAVSSLQSDLLLASIKNLANLPATIDALNLRRAVNENVTHRVVMPGELLNLVTMPMRDSHGQGRLNYLLQLSNPSDFVVAENDKRYYFSVEVLAQVLTPDGKTVYTQRKKVSRYLSKDELADVQGKPFGYEGWLPLAPGKYKLSFVLTNLLAHSSFSSERDVVMPAAPVKGLWMTPLIPFIDAKALDSAAASVAPFSSGGVKFTPYAGKEVAVVPGQDLKVFYQIWQPLDAVGHNAGTRLAADYVYGQMGIQGSTKQVHEEVAKDQFDSNGSMLSGKKFSTLEMGVGRYRLALTLSDPDTQEKTFGSLTYSVVSERPSVVETWDVFDNDLLEYVNKGQADYEMGMSYLAQGDNVSAVRWLQQAVSKGPAQNAAREQLVSLYFGQGAYDKVVGLFIQADIGPQTQDQTILDFADSFDKTGDTKKAIRVMESAIELKSGSGPLYLALANYYQKVGNAQKAEELQNKGKSLLSVVPAS